jgi:hypothetical protein
VNSPVLTDALVEAEKQITAHVLGAAPPGNQAMTRVKLVIQGNYAWLETERGTRINNIVIEDISYSRLLDVHVKFKFITGENRGEENLR